MNLERLLSTQKLVQQTPTSEELIERSQVLSGEPLKIFYGETFDEKGNTVDSMKYYFFVSLLGDALRERGIKIEPTILIADSAACRNSPGNEASIMSLGHSRFDFVKRVNDVYGTGLNVIKMSEYIDTPEFIEKRQEIIDVCSGDPLLMESVRKTVPESKQDIEKSKGYFYSFDEITSIIDLDVKVGPPREDLYDNIARKIASQRGKKQIMSLFLSPTFPLGMGWSYFFINEGIEDHGITAYKAGSKRLHRNRIIVGSSNPEYIRSLIEKSFISQNPSLPNPVLDLGLICEMAKNKLGGNKADITLADDFYKGRISPEELKLKVSHDVEKYIISKF